jgi:hypothetical protein
MRLLYAKGAIRDLEKFARSTRERIQEKIEWYLLQENPLFLLNLFLAPVDYLDIELESIG